MKKIIFLFAILSSFSSIAQGPPMWSNGGNNVNSGDYVGTNNNQPLIFKTNSVERSRILPTGEFQIGSGGLKINPGTYNASPIGAYMIEVGGSAYIDRSLFVKEYINSLKGLRGPKIDVDSIIMDSTRGIYGKTKIFGDVQIQQNLTVNGDATFNGKIKATTKFEVDGNSTFAGDLTVSSLSGIGNRSVYVDALGNLIVGRPAPPSSWECIAGTPSWQIGGNNWSGLGMSYPGLTDANIGTCDNYDFILKSDDIQRIWIKNNGNIGIWSSNPLTRLTVDSKSGDGIKNITDNDNTKAFIGFQSTSLKENFVIYGDGNTHLGKNVQIGFANSTIQDANTSLNIYTDSKDGIKLGTWNNVAKVISIENTANFNNRSPFIVTGSGYTSIGSNQNTGNILPYKMLTVNGDASFANYGDPTDGVNGFEILGNDQIPTQRGISLEPITSGSGMSFYIKTNTYANGQGSFKFINTALGGTITKVLFEINKFGGTTINCSGNDAFMIKSQQTGVTSFNVFGNGHVRITPKVDDALVVVDDATSDVNFKVKKTGFVYAREINVQATPFPDYVFEKSYKRLTIPELDKYISENKHLPGFKKGEEYDKEGLNVSELLIKQQEKIEELALYIIELEKRLNKVETKK